MEMNRIFVQAAVGLCALMAASAYASDYKPLLHNYYNSNYQSLYAPDSWAVSTEAGVTNIPFRFGSTSNLRWRVFIPPGTKSLQMTEYMYASPPDTKVVARFGSPPRGSDIDGEAYSIDHSTVLARLVANGGGTELSMWAPDGAGSVKISDTPKKPLKTTNGGWIYLNTVQSPGNMIYELNAMVEVDEACYRSWFANAKWDSDGNPAEDATHTCSGSSGGGDPTGGGTDPAVLTGFTLSTTTLAKGSTASVTITPIPATASVKNCYASYPGGVYDVLAINGNKITLADAARYITSTQLTTINCGAFSESLAIEVPSGSDDSLAGITLSASSLNKGSTGSIQINPVPSYATLPACFVFYYSDYADLVRVDGNKVSLASGAAALTQVANVTIQCGSASADLTIGMGGAGGQSLTGIKLSSPSMVLGEGRSVTIEPVPVGATLPVCEASTQYGPTSLVGILDNAQVVDGRSADLLSSQSSVTISCGSVSAPLEVFPRGTTTGTTPVIVLTPGATVTETTTAGNLTLNVDLVPNTAEKGKAVRLWIAAKVPGYKLGLATDAYFFNTNPTWKVLEVIDGFSLDGVTFARFAVIGEKQRLVLQTGLPKADLRAYAVELIAFYFVDGSTTPVVLPLWK